MTTTSDTAKTEAFVGRLFNAALGSIDLLSVYVGDRLGLYKTLAEKGPSTSAELAKRAKVNERYARGGSLIVADERVADTFNGPGDDAEWFMYGASIFVCLPSGMAEKPSAATGTGMRAPTFKRYAAQAGFRDVQVLPIEKPFLRFYRLTP
ncbi:MAG: hypothetical protein FJ312_03460 [SAR202 cluster bacterium]|nr:hypothetical protein [SAR202 cluster bacterium]